MLGWSDESKRLSKKFLEHRDREIADDLLQSSDKTTVAKLMATVDVINFT